MVGHEALAGSHSDVCQSWCKLCQTSRMHVLSYIHSTVMASFACVQLGAKVCRTRRCHGLRSVWWSNNRVAQASRTQELMCIRCLPFSAGRYQPTTCVSCQRWLRWWQISQTFLLNITKKNCMSEACRYTFYEEGIFNIHRGNWQLPMWNTCAILKISPQAWASCVIKWH